ncbi:MAG: hypothetical protein P8H03_11170 [Emcibacteraceae bacterium]|nr:hypothetical protein [Emcibacteraceae bacterium]MDG1858325.1 hypothetical protein [Emcibacteraceae bacterium]
MKSTPSILIILGLYFAGMTQIYAQSSSVEKPVSIVSEPWLETVVSVHDLDETARFFTEIAGYEVIWRGSETSATMSHLGLNETASAQSLVLSAKGSNFGRIRLIKFSNAGEQVPIRPGSRPWDTGCYFSIMMRAKNLDQLYADAIRLGWWTETPITDLEFGTSKLKVVIFKGPQGVQVQTYERISPPLAKEFPKFEKLSVPFNIMQTVRNRQATREFYVDLLGFDTFYLGDPYVDTEPAPMPLGIPVNLTTSSRYQAGIFYPKSGEVGRIETIEFMDLDGANYSDRCMAPNFGTFSIKFKVSSVRDVKQELENRGLKQNTNITRTTIHPYGNIDIFTIKSPDGANIEFFSSVQN